MTTEDFNVLLRSMEGQFQINLARPWAHENDQGGVQRLLAPDAITVTNKKLENAREGVVNSNSNNKTLSTICSYIQCDEITQCINSFIPFGHCCPVCGTRIELVAFELSFDLASAAVYNVLNALETEATVFATFERKTTTWRNSLYEVALITAKNSTFEEDFHVLAAKEIIEKLAITMKSNHHNAILNFSVFSSKIDRSVKLMSKVVACVIYFAVLVLLAGMFVYQNVEMRVARKTIFNPVIKYRRQNDDDVAIEMDGVEQLQNPEDLTQQPENPEQETSKIITTQPTLLPKIEDDGVEDWRNINPNFELASSEEVPSQMVFELVETKKPEVENEQEPKNDSEEDSGVTNQNFLDDFFESPMIPPQNVEFPEHFKSSENAENLAENSTGTFPTVETLLDLEAEGAVDSEKEDQDQEDYANPLFINPNFFENSSESSVETQAPEPTLDTVGDQEAEQEGAQEDENKENEPKEDEGEDGMDLVQF
ncbi:hypothetical protein CAEBREN_22248 [Caenorhabditis brenneri]|uniref:Protein amnionless n=1 Tax=Caenorhabditis brenneri TaxID=135651 RepID=G0M9A9_CAEBE|nr:hypothetical protein CAEBREN_22248 [Caenorhabditis brenneri]